VFFYGVYHLANTGLFLGRKLKWSALAWAMAGVVSLIANAVWVPRYGAMAAAAVQCGTFAGLALSVWLLSQRIHPLPLPIRRIAMATTLALLGVVVGSRLPGVVDTATAGMKALFLCVVCLTVLWVMEPGMLVRARRGLTGIGQ